MTVRTYVITHDFGFAPNPFGGTLSLACCKPAIRKTAKVGDYLLGTLPSARGANLLCFAGQVTSILTHTEYRKTYAAKRPEGSSYGDAIYFRDDDGLFKQIKNRFHDANNTETDTSVDRVLVCDRFWYFGDKPVLLPDELFDGFVKRGPGHRNSDDKKLVSSLEQFLAQYSLGVHGEPSPVPKKRIRVKAR